MISVYTALGLIAGILQWYSVVPYIKDMIHGETRPSMVSMALWTSIQLVIIAAQFVTGPTWAIIIPVVMTFNTILILILGLRGYGYTTYGWIDGVCITIVILALVAWYTTNDPLLALLLSIVADFTASIPALIKVLKHPFSESLQSWIILIIANICAVASVPHWTIVSSAFSMYVVTVDTLFISTMMLLRRRLRPKID